MRVEDVVVSAESDEVTKVRKAEKSSSSVVGGARKSQLDCLTQAKAVQGFKVSGTVSRHCVT